MIHEDTIKLLRECDAGVKMGISSIDDVLNEIHDSKFKEILNTCKEEHKKIDEKIQTYLDQYHDEGKEPNVAEENLQSRIRGMILMGIANKIGAALLNTTNKSELSVGYGTLYGDTNGAIGALGDIFKTDVWEMSRWINRNEEIIPQNSIIKAPSAELRPDQKDTDSLPDYDILDKVLFLHLEQRLSREEIINQGFESNTVDKILRLVKINEWKRNQVAPLLRMSNSALGIERIMPIS